MRGSPSIAKNREIKSENEYNEEATGRTNKVAGGLKFLEMSK